VDFPELVPLEYEIDRVIDKMEAHGLKAGAVVLEAWTEGLQNFVSNKDDIRTRKNGSRNCTDAVITLSAGRRRASGIAQAPTRRPVRTAISC